MRGLWSLVVAAFVVCLVGFAAAARAEDTTLAITYGFTGSGGGTSGNPTLAFSAFLPGGFFAENNADKITTATHELFHAVGWTVNYDTFSAKIFLTPGQGTGPIPANSRVYSTNGTVGGIKMVLIPSGNGTHSDQNATGAAPWPATGYNQANDIMQTNLVSGSTLTAADAAVLNDAFTWSTRGIKINLLNDDPTDFAPASANLADINAAITAVQTLFNGVNPAGDGELHLDHCAGTFFRYGAAGDRDWA